MSNDGIVKHTVTFEIDLATIVEDWQNVHRKYRVPTDDELSAYVGEWLADSGWYAEATATEVQR